VFVYPVLGLILLGAILSIAGFGGTDTGGTDVEPTASEAAADEEIDRHTVTVNVTDDDGNVISNADVEFVHDDAIIFDTRETKQTDDNGIATFETDHDSNVRISAEASGYEDAETRITITESEEVTLALADEPEEVEANDEEATNNTDEREIDTDEAEARADPDDVDDELTAETDGGQVVEQEADQGEISPELFEAFLITNGFEVEVDQTDGITWVDHTTYEGEPEELAVEIAGIAGAYSAMVDSGTDTEMLWVLVYHPSGELIAEWWIDSDWAQAYADGEITDEEYLALVLETIET
jgi:hypothetical protein